MERIRNRVFSVEEANRLLPYLEQALGGLNAQARAIASLQSEMRVLSVIEDSGASGRNADVRELREKETGLTRLTEEFRAALHEVASQGCILRDLDLGLVDFYTMSRHEIVCLCWRVGEARISHWHTVDEGFSGRRPLSELL
jgi:hypothetical protein